MLRSSRFARVASVTCLATLFTAPAGAQSPDSVLVVVNEASADSRTIASRYVEARRIPADNVVTLTIGEAETISRDAFEQQIERPLSSWLTRHGLQDQVLYIVLTRGVPLRIIGTGGPNGTGASVDSELTLLYRKMTGRPASPIGRVRNPYFSADLPTEPFRRDAYDIYLVTRLDAFSLEDTLSLVSRGLEPSAAGRFVLDRRNPDSRSAPDAWLQEAAGRLERAASPARVALDQTEPDAGDGPVLGYYSWGSLDPTNRRRMTGLTFSPGAIAATAVGADARTFREPPSDWVPGRTIDRSAFHAGGNQSLAGDLIREGATGVGANVADPLVDGLVRPDVLFPAYLSGSNLAEAFYRSIPFLSWQTVVIGDPLVAPFGQAASGPVVEGGLDPVTGMPVTFAGRRLAVLSESGRRPEALRRLMRADVLTLRGDEAGAEAALVEAASLDPRLVEANLRLAQINDTRGDADEAIARYRLVLEVQPRNAVVLNNLAYSLAVNKQQLDEAIVLARRAAQITSSPVVADTLGWIHFLQGDISTAAFWIERAAAGAPKNAEVLFHAASVHLAQGDRARARKELDAALALDSALGSRPDVVALVERLKAPSPA